MIITSILDYRRVDADAENLVFLLDQVAFARDEDIVAIEKERALRRSLRGRGHEPVKLQRNGSGRRRRRRSRRDRRALRDLNRAFLAVNRNFSRLFGEW